MPFNHLSSMPLLKKLFLHNPLLLRNLLRRFIRPYRLLTAANRDSASRPWVERGCVLVVRPLRHVFDNLLRESVADDAAGFPRFGNVSVAAVRVVAGVVDLSVGEDSGCSGKEQGEGEEFHPWNLLKGSGFGFGCLGVDVPIWLEQAGSRCRG